MFSKKIDYPIGLDISDLSLKFVQLQKRGRALFFQAFGKVSLENGWIKNGSIEKKEKVQKAIKELLAKPLFGKVSSNQIVTSLPEPRTFIKLIKINADPDNFKKNLLKELEKHMPFSIDEIYYDYEIVKSTEEQDWVIFGASPKSYVDQYLELFQDSGFMIMGMEIESTAVARSLLLEESPDYKTSPKKNYGVLDIGANRSSMFVYSKNTILFNVSIPISGNNVSDKIAESLKLDKKQGELAKIVCGLDDKKCSAVKDNLSQMIDLLIIEIKKVINFYNSHFSERGSLDKIILSGGGANIDGLTNLIKAKIGIDTEIGDVFTNISEPKNISVNLGRPKDIFIKDFVEVYKYKAGEGTRTKKKTISIKQDSSITYATAIGLALRKIFVD